MVWALRRWHGAQPLCHRVGAEEVRKGRGAEPEVHVVNEAGRGGGRGEMSSKPMMEVEDKGKKIISPNLICWINNYFNGCGVHQQRYDTFFTIVLDKYKS